MSSDWQDLSYAGQLTDNEPLITVQYSAEWLEFLLAVADVLRQDRLWEPGTDMDAVDQQVEDLLARLMGESAMVVTHVQSPIEFSAVNVKRVGTFTITEFILDTPWMYQNGIYTDGVNSIGDVVEFEAFLTAGTWKVEVRADQKNDRGKFLYKVNDGDFAVSSTFDCYSASPNYNYKASNNLVISEDGLYKFTIERQSKNPSSSAGILLFYCFVLRKA